MKRKIPQGVADFGGALNAGLCLVHCLAGPLLLAVWGSHTHTSEVWDIVFLVISGVLIALATRRSTTRAVRLALWGCFALFAAAWLLRTAYPWLEAVQYLASIGLIVAHIVNLRLRHRNAQAPQPQLALIGSEPLDNHASKLEGQADAA